MSSSTNKDATKIHAVIFDLDGLLIDSEVSFFKIYQDLLAPYHHEITLNQYAEEYCGKTLVQNMSRLIEEFHLPLTLDETIKQIRSLEQHYIDKGIPLKPGAMELLTYLKNHQIKIALATSSIAKRATTILNQNKVLNFFDVLTFATDVERGKPFPDIFLKACERLNEKPENCLVLEDSEAGIQASYTANIPVICIPDIKQPNQKYIDMCSGCFESLTNVIQYIENN